MKNKSIFWIGGYFMLSILKRLRSSRQPKKCLEKPIIKLQSVYYPTKDWEQLSFNEKFMIQAIHYKNIKCIPSRLALFNDLN